MLCCDSFENWPIEYYHEISLGYFTFAEDDSSTATTASAQSLLQQVLCKKVVTKARFKALQARLEDMSFKDTEIGIDSQGGHSFEWAKTSYDKIQDTDTTPIDDLRTRAIDESEHSSRMVLKQKKTGILTSWGTVL
ncbi:hypothetical protein MMC28_007079 [Mycoblastus sanguinarius]|nr:hypothetical protein [Mycoblastus sanguinarius]